MIQIKWWSRLDDDPDQVMIQMWWWSRLDDDLDQMMIHIWWWSSSDDQAVAMIQIPWWRRLEEEDDLEEDLKMKMTWGWRRIEYEGNLKMKMTRWSSWYREEDQYWKLCRKNTFLVKRECWCNCNFEMYSAMYIMSCTPMFILGCVCNVIESCHALMFWSGGSIM